MPNMQNRDGALIIVYLIDHAIVAHADAPTFPSG